MTSTKECLDVILKSKQLKFMQIIVQFQYLFLR